MHTSAAWFTVSESDLMALGHDRAALIDALRSIGHALHLVASVGLMCDGRDLGHCLKDPRGSEGQTSTSVLDPTLFLYDSVAGGIGLAARIFENRARIVQRAYELVNQCSCENGCPTCIGVGTLDLTATIQPRSKALAGELLREALGARSIQ